MVHMVILSRGHVYILDNHIDNCWVGAGNLYTWYWEVWLADAVAKKAKK